MSTAIWPSSPHPVRKMEVQDRCVCVCARDGEKEKSSGCSNTKSQAKREREGETGQRQCLWKWYLTEAFEAPGGQVLLSISALGALTLGPGPCNKASIQDTNSAVFTRPSFLSSCSRNKTQPNGSLWRPMHVKTHVNQRYLSISVEWRQIENHRVQCPLYKYVTLKAQNYISYSRFNSSL